MFDCDLQLYWNCKLCCNSDCPVIQNYFNLGDVYCHLTVIIEIYPTAFSFKYIAAKFCLWYNLNCIVTTHSHVKKSWMQLVFTLNKESRKYKFNFQTCLSILILYSYVVR